MLRVKFYFSPLSPAPLSPSSCTAQKENIWHFLSHVSQGLDNYLGNYDNILLLGDFNSTMYETHMKNFCELYDLQNLIKDPTCYKNASNPSSIDVILTNRKNSFQNSMGVETGLSEYHKMMTTVYFKKKEPITVKLRSMFRDNLLNNLHNTCKETMD